MKTYSEHLFHTGWFVESLLTQTLIVHIIRTNRIPFIQSRASAALTWTTITVMAAAIFLPFFALGSASLRPRRLCRRRPSWLPWMMATLVCYIFLTHKCEILVYSPLRSRLMRSLLNALHDGRLIELPDTDKLTSLKYLAHLIEAIPEVKPKPIWRSKCWPRSSPTIPGSAWAVACPHVRVPGNGELISAVGWSPAGIDYGSKDGIKVHLVVMYYIPESQKNTYLKEVSSLVRAVRPEGEIQ